MSREAGLQSRPSFFPGSTGLTCSAGWTESSRVPLRETDLEVKHETRYKESSRLRKEATSAFREELRVQGTAAVRPSESATGRGLCVLDVVGLTVRATKG